MPDLLAPPSTRRAAWRLPAFWAFFAALTGFYVLSNPHYNGDATFYAASLADSGQPTWRPGHALWEPVTLLTIRVLGALGVRLDTLLVMQLLSAAATTALVVVTYYYGLRLRLTRGTALGGAALLACIANSFIMGGGGYTATSLSLATMVAALVLTRPDGGDWRVRDGAIVIISLALGWGAWGIAALAYPAVFLIAVRHGTGTAIRRLSRATLLMIASGVATAVLAALIWLGPAGAGEMSLLEWLRSANHSIVYQPPDLRDAMRPGLGIIRAFVELGTFGFSIKAAMLGEWSLVNWWEVVRWSLVLGVLAILAIRAFAGLAQRLRHHDQVAQELAILSLATIVPTYAFSIFYGGTDYHMHSTALPFLCLTLALGLNSLRPVRVGPIASIAGPASLALLVGLANLVGTVLPDWRTRGGFSMALARNAAAQLPPKSLLVVTGQDFRGAVIGVVTYHARIRVFNVANDVDYYGAEAWRPHMLQWMKAAVDSGGAVAVLSDFVGDSTPGGLQISAREHPLPSFAEVGAAMAGWTATCRWTAGGFGFVTLTPPGQSPRACEPASGDTAHLIDRTASQGHLALVAETIAP